MASQWQWIWLKNDYDNVGCTVAATNVNDVITVAMLNAYSHFSWPLGKGCRYTGIQFHIPRWLVFTSHPEKRQWKIGDDYVDYNDSNDNDDDDITVQTVCWLVTEMVSPIIQAVSINHHDGGIIMMMTMMIIMILMMMMMTMIVIIMMTVTVTMTMTVMNRWNNETDSACLAVVS